MFTTCLLPNYILKETYHYPTTTTSWVGLGISKILFGTIPCLFYLAIRLNVISSGEVLSLNIIRMKRLIAIE